MCVAPTLRERRQMIEQASEQTQLALTQLDAADASAAFDALKRGITELASGFSDASVSAARTTLRAQGGRYKEKIESLRRATTMQLSNQERAIKAEHMRTLDERVAHLTGSGEYRSDRPLAVRTQRRKSDG